MKRPNLTAFLFILSTLALMFLMGLLIGLFTKRGAISPDLMSAMQQGLAPALILALGMALVVVYHGVDFSVAGIVSLTVVVASLTANASGSFFTAFLAGMGLALLVGFINAAVVSWLRMPSYITTLATWGATAHLAVLLSGDSTITLSADLAYPNLASWSYTGGLFLLLGLAAPILVYGGLRLMVFKERASVGGTFAAYLLSAYAAAMAGFVFLCAGGVADPTVGDGRQWAAIAAVILGGVFLFRGAPAALYGFATTTLAVLILFWFEAVGEAIEFSPAQIVGLIFLPPILCGFVYALAARVLFEFKPKPKRVEDVDDPTLPF